MLRGLIADWPAVAACRETSGIAAYLSSFATEEPVTAYLAEPEHQGRYFYNGNMDGFNFKSAAAPLGQVLGRLTAIAAGDHEPQSIYVGSTMVDKWLPGFREVNDLDLAADNPLVSFGWVTGHGFPLIMIFRTISPVWSRATDALLCSRLNKWEICMLAHWK